MKGIIALDVDQTYTACPEMWLQAIDMFHSFGFHVIVVTMRAHKQAWDTLDLLHKVGADNFDCTAGQLKADYMRDKSHVDIWIDDMPESIGSQYHILGGPKP